MKVFKFLGKISSSLLLVILIVAVAFLGGTRLMGCELFSVLSGSMEPNYHVGSLIVVKKTDAGEVEVGDVITYVLNEDLVTVTHRVVEKLDEEQRFITKGDANEDIDAVKVHYNNLIGKPVIQIPKMGYVTVFLNTTKGKIIAGTVLIALCLIMFVPDMIGEDEENTKKRQREGG